MGRTFTVNLDRDTGKYLLEEAKRLGINPSRLVRSLIFRYFGAEDDMSDAQPPKSRYALKDRLVLVIYLPDDIADALVGHLEATGSDLSGFVRGLLRAEKRFIRAVQ